MSATEGEVLNLIRIIGNSSSNPAALIERRCKVKTTSRFYATTAKILHAAKAA